MKQACYWGRFNPPHHGHMNMIKKILKESDELILVVGAKEKKNTKRNPFSGRERVKMMKAFLKEGKIPSKKIKIITIKDGPSWKDARRKFLKKCPNANVIYTDKKRVIKHLGDKMKIKIIKREGEISSTKIRKAIAENKDYSNLTGKSVIKLIKKYKGEKRITKHI